MGRDLQVDRHECGIFLKRLRAAAAACMMIVAGSAFAVQTVTLADFESGGTAGAAPAGVTNSAATAGSNSVLANVADGGSQRLQLTDPDGLYNGAVITFPGAI